MLPWIAAGWLGGLFAGAQWHPAAGALFTAFGLIGALSIATRGAELSARLWSLPLGALAFCCGLGVAHAPATPCAVRGEVFVKARVESVRYGIGDARLRLRVEGGRVLDSHRALQPGLELNMNVPVRTAPPRESLVALRAFLSPRTELRNPSPHPRLSSSKIRACWARQGDSSPIEVLDVSSWAARIDRVRARVRAHMDAHLPQTAAGVARALVLGDGGAIDHAQRQTIASVGLAHLFAVSGLHVALVSGTSVHAIHWLLRGLTIGFDPRRLAATLGIPLTLFHAFFAGGSPSAWRAAITAAFTWGLVAIGRRPSSAPITATAALALSAPDPSMALRPAFLLSIIATSAILSMPRVPPSKRWPRLRSAAIISARTLIATTPMVWWWFGGVPLVGWLANIVVLPIGTGLVIPLAHLFALTSWVPAAVHPLGAALTVSVRALLALCDVFAPLAVTRHLPPLDVTQGLVVLGACLLLLTLRSWSSRIAVLAAATLLWMGAEHSLISREHPRNLLRVSFVDVGQGDAALVDFPDGRFAVIDTGQGGRHPAVRELRDLLAARRRSRIDLLIITHGHPDHYGGLGPILQEIDVGEIWVNGQLVTEEADAVMTALLTSAMAQGTRVRFAPELCDRNHRFGAARLEVLWPCPRYDPALGLNDNSVALRIGFGRRAFLFTGDLEHDAERRLLNTDQIAPVDVLKVAHHGSKTSSTWGFLEAARPALAVISSGAGNRYGHPSPSVLRRLREAGARVVRTDLGGGVIVSTDGKRLWVYP